MDMLQTRHPPDASPDGAFRKRRALLMLALLLPVMGASGCASHKPEPLRIGVNVWPPYELLYLARERGFFAGEGVEVELVDFSSYNGVLRAYHQENIDGLLATLNEIQITDNFADQPAVVLVVDYSYGGDALVARSGVAGVAGLRGGRIAYEESPLGSYVLERALQSAGLTTGDVTLLNRLPDDGEKDFRAGRADAVVTYEPILGRILRDGAGQVLFSSRQMPGEIVDVLAMRRSVLRRRPDDVRRLLRAWFRALGDLQVNPQDAAAIMARHQGGDAAVFLSGLEASYIPTRHENLKLMGTSMTPGDLHRTADQLGAFLLRRGLARRIAGGAELLDAGILESL